MSTRRAFPFFCVLAGLVLAAVALVTGFFLGIFALFECKGSDTSEPPVPGSREHTLCGWPATVAFWSCVPVAVAAPVFGGLWSAVVGRVRPLALGLALAAAALTALSAFLAVLFGGPEVAVAPASVFVVALVIERFVKRREQTEP